LLLFGRKDEEFLRDRARIRAEFLCTIARIWSPMEAPRDGDISAQQARQKCVLFRAVAAEW